MWLLSRLFRRGQPDTPTASDGGTPSQDGLSSLLSDAPLRDPEQDRLGRAPFAKAIARSIAGISNPEGFVFALYAPWGSGKSSTLNFVLHYVEESILDGRVLVLRFDPWWYTGEEQLVLQFFRQLMLALGQTDVSADLKKLGGRLEAFARVVAPLSYIPLLV